MTDIERFLAAERQGEMDYATKKQLRFELRVVDKLLRGLEAAPGVANGIKMEAADELSMRWLMSRFDSFPVKLGTYKSPKCVHLVDFLKNPEKTKIWDEFLEVAANYDSNCAGLVFASEGDGLQELILHTAVGRLPPPPRDWRAVLYGGYYALESLKGFINSIRATDWQFNL